MAKNKLNVLQIVLICVAVVGVILAIVGIAVSWYSYTVTSLGSHTENYGLFAKEFNDTDVGFPIGVVRAFGIISLILTVAACAVMCLNSLGLVKIKWLYRVICAAVVILFAVLTFIFGLVYAGKFNDKMGYGDVAKFAASAGAYLLPIGSIITAVPLFLGKE